MYCINKAELNLINNIRMLWEQHSTWTGAAITSITLKLPNEEFVVNRLLRNPMDFAIALTPFYGNIISSQFGELLTEHLQLAAQLIKAIIDENHMEAENIEKKWYENADEIVSLLGGINPYWSAEDWRIMFYMHLKFVKKEAIYMIDEKYEEAIKIQDLLELEALEMANMMAHGIIKQFPHMFCN